MSNTGRATSIAEMDALQGKLFTEESFLQGIAVKLNPTDVVITPYAKSGTTWLQQIVHTLRTRGDMDFDDISRVVPWIETSVGLGIDLSLPQKAEPRAFKSHLDWPTIPKGGRYINAVRDPADALVSMHKFMEGWFLEPGAVSVDELARERFIASKAYWQHLRSWWQQRNEANVLFLAYEHMKQDLPGTIARVADFIDIKLDDELLAITEQHASFEFMINNKDRFDDAMMRKLSEEKAGIPAGSDSAKVSSGESGSGKAVLSAEILQELDQVWFDEITTPLGYKNYQSLIADLNGK